ncbi:DEAD/DEAH box helicase family protein [Saccharomyces cerevisiae]|nr:DEAD/DEAH box helicase family protein [Saccharomyces cerevisiae]
MTAALKNKVAVAIDELTVPLMWMIHFAVGYPYRYPELQLLAFAGPQRNVYVDDTTRRIQLYTDYNKNGSSEPRLKTLDGLTSDYRWIQWLGLESDYHCSFSSTRNAEDVVAGEAASSNHHQKISRVTRKRPREPKSTNDILVAGQKLFGSSFEFRDLHQLRLCYEIYMADTPSVAVQAPPGYGKTELFHLPLIALASKGDVKYVSFLFVPYTVLLANCMIRLGRRGCLNVAPVRNFIEEGYDGVTDLYVGIYDDLASTNFTDGIAAWENIVECTFRTNNVKLGYLIVDEFHNFETEVYRHNLLSGTAPEAVADAALQRIGLTGLAKKSMDINELKRSEDLSRGLSSYPTRMFNLIKEKSEVPLGTSATTTASINVRTSATTTESTNSNTNATTTESTNSNTNATTTESTNSSTNATTTESTNSSTNATTTESTNSSTNATTTESTNASAKEDANKDGNAEDNRFHPVTDINKESYKRKGSQMVLLERKKLKAQFPNTSENMNVLQFLGFRSDEIKHLFLYGIDIYFCPEGVFTQYGYARAVKRCSSSVSVGLARKYRIGG